MKKIVTIIIAILACINANAQWKQTFIKGDELKGTIDRIEFEYRDPETRDRFSFYDHYREGFEISTYRSIFNYSFEISEFGNCFTKLYFVKIGFYEGDKLIDKVTLDFFVSESGHIAWPMPDANKISARVINHLENIGSIRIIASVYGAEPNYDVTIPMKNIYESEKSR